MYGSGRCDAGRLRFVSCDADAATAEAGEKHYTSYCAACHGADGTGNPLLGAPNLTNGIWLYGGTREQIAHTLRVGRNGQMPAFNETLSEDKATRMPEIRRLVAKLDTLRDAPALFALSWAVWREATLRIGLAPPVGYLTDLNVSLEVTHTWVGDLSFTLTHQDTGTSVTVFDRPGVPGSTYGCQNDNINATLDDEAFDNAMKHRAVIETAVDVLEKILSVRRRILVE